MRDDGAAEVIGVILIIGITVVIAAVVAAFAMGMGSSVKKNVYQAYFTIDRSDMYNDVTITNVGGKDINLLTDSIEISYTNATGVQTPYDTPSDIVADSGGLAHGDLSNLPASQLVLSPSMIDPNGQCHILIKGTFVDGDQQLLLQADT